MSTWKPLDCPCPSCGHENTIPVLKGLHVTRLPSQRQAILDGTFQRYECADCSERFLYEGSTVYTDFDRMEYIAVEPPPATAWREDRQKHASIYDRNVQFGPEIARDLASGLRTRLVYGLSALREKLLAWDHEVDDQLLELCKAAWIEKRGLQPGQVLLRLNAVLPGGHLLLARLEPDTRPPTAHGGAGLPRKVENVVIRAEDVARVQSRQSVLIDSAPWLREPWLVDLHDACPHH